MRFHTRGRGAVGGRHRGRLAGHLPDNARQAHGLRRRRVLPDGAATLPRTPNATTAFRCTRTASAWRARSKPSSTVTADEATGVQRGFFAAVDAPPNPAAYTGLRPSGGPAGETSQPGAGSTAHRAALRPSGDRRRSACSRESSVHRSSRRWSNRSVAPTSESCRSRTEFFGGNTGVTGLMTGEDVSRVLAARTGRSSVSAARRVPVRRRTVPRRCRLGDLPRPVEVDRHRRHRAPCGARPHPNQSDNSEPDMTTTTHIPEDLLDLDPEAISDLAAGRSPTIPPPICRPSSSSVDQMSARARSSTGSSAASRRSSRIGRASPATARSSKPSGSTSRSCVVDTGGWMPGGDALDVKVSRQVEAAVKEADVVLFVIDASVSV